MKIFNISPYLNNMVIQVIAILHCHIVYVWSYCVLLESLAITEVAVAELAVAELTVGELARVELVVAE